MWGKISETSKSTAEAPGKTATKKTTPKEDAEKTATKKGKAAKKEPTIKSTQASSETPVNPPGDKKTAGKKKSTFAAGSSGKKTNAQSTQTSETELPPDFPETEVPDPDELYTTVALETEPSKARTSVSSATHKKSEQTKSAEANANSLYRLRKITFQLAFHTKVGEVFTCNRQSSVVR